MSYKHCQVPPNLTFALPLLPQNRDDDEGYDSDTADAVKRRLRHLAREQREQQPAAGAAAAPLPGCLYDERVERKQLEQQQRQQQKVEQQLEQQRRSGSREQRSGDRHGSREHRGERHRSRERHAERRRSRSRSQERQHMRRRSRSRSRERRHGHTDHRSSSHRQRSRSRERRLGSGGAGGAGNAAGLQRLDFEAIIPGYSAMTAPQVLGCTCAPQCMLMPMQGGMHLGCYSPAMMRLPTHPSARLLACLPVLALGRS